MPCTRPTCLSRLRCGLESCWGQRRSSRRGDRKASKEGLREGLLAFEGEQVADVLLKEQDDRSNLLELVQAHLSAISQRQQPLGKILFLHLKILQLCLELFNIICPLD